MPEALQSLADGDAALLRECGIQGAERATYTAAGGRFFVTLYRMRDATSSYAAYTALRVAEMTASDLTEKSAVSRDRILAVVGNLLVDVRSPGVASLADLKTLVASIKLQAELAPFPTLWQYLPSQGLVPNSARYVLGSIGLQRALPDSGLLLGQDWIGFSTGAEAQVAHYRLQEQSVSLLLASYPTPQVALRRLAEWNNWFVVNPDEADAEKGKSDGSTDPRPTIYVQRTGSLLAVVVGSRSAALARGLLAHVQFEREIVWTEPSWKARERPFVELLLMVFVGTGVILLYLMVSSLAFGFIRVAVTKVLPGKVFDRPSDLEFLQLRLGAKPFQTKDLHKDSHES